MQHKPKRKRDDNNTTRILIPILLGACAILLLGILALGIFIVQDDNIQVATSTTTSSLTIAQSAQTDTCATLIRPPQTMESNVTNAQQTTGAYAEDAEIEYETSADDAVDMDEIVPLGTPVPAPADMSSSGADGLLLRAPMSEAEERAETTIATESESRELASAPEPSTEYDGDDAAFFGDADIADDAVVGGVGSRSGSSFDVIAEQQVSEPLRAGEIDDNADWDTYMDYRRDYFSRGNHMESTVNDIDITDRQVIRVTGQDGQAIMGACVQVYNGQVLVAQSRTYATGMTMYFPNASESTRYVEEFRVVASKGDATQEVTMNRETVGGVTNITLPMERDVQDVRLDVVFLLDATGSMGDEIAQLQENLLAISGQIDEFGVDARYGLVHYRDNTDAYIVKSEQMTDNVRQFQTALNNVVANGGGDYPEDMDAGLSVTLNNMAWRGEDTIKLVILVADAPPHVDRYPQYNYSHMMQQAREQGIKIHTIASSGLQDEGEFIMRQIAQQTMGNFLFLTYDETGASGTSGDHRPDLEVGAPKDEQGVGDYDVSQLDELVLRLIEDEIEAFMGE